MKGAGLRKREYTLYARERGDGFTTKSVCYSNGTHRWRYRVFATSVRQAYALASREAIATDGKAIGVREYECDWWHGMAASPVDAERKGLRFLAPYLRTDAMPGREQG